MKHNYEERRQNRIDHAENQAAKNEKQSEQLYGEAKKMAEAIPFGQPILIGHHSEQRDRNYRKKIRGKFDKSFEAGKMAEYYSDKAATIASNQAVFSDDPEALTKLRQKLADQVANHAFMKATNKYLRKGDKEGFLKIPGASVKIWDQLTAPSSTRPTGFPGYAFQNSNAEINRLKKRIAFLEAQATRKTRETVINGVRLVENVEANRLQLIFDGIPAEETRKRLKSNGFRWCPSEGAWQRHLSTSAIWSGKDILNNL
jgi:hypothetical protein